MLEPAASPAKQSRVRKRSVWSWSAVVSSRAQQRPSPSSLQAQGEPAAAGPGVRAQFRWCSGGFWPSGRVTQGL